MAIYDPQLKRQLTILIVEDERLYRTIASQTLTGHKKIMSQEKEKGYALFLEHCPDIVFLDISLPDGSGLELLKTMKEFDPAVFVVMMTKSSYSQDVNQSIIYGANGYIIKPFNQQHIDLYLERFYEENPKREMKEICKRRNRYGEEWVRYQQDKGLFDEYVLSSSVMGGTRPLDEVSAELKERIDNWSVLYIDQNIDNIRHVEIGLSDYGCKVDVSLSGQDASEKLLSSVYDIIFVECSLNDVDGYQLANMLRNHEKKLPRYTYVMGIVADQHEGNTQKWQLSGMDGVMVKPLSIQDIYNKIVLFAQRSLEKGEQEFVV
ncbi:MAG: response regulator [Alphaproteobacteria bacterium]|nr:response regulator [Alphaproteobacteria bacterium]